MYSILDTKNTPELSLIRQGWFSREYELTDGINIYGKITYHLFSQRRATAVSAASTWAFQREAPFNRTIPVTDENDVKIGEITRGWFSLRSTLTLQTGFRADFYKKSFFSGETIWEADDYGQIMRINSPIFNSKGRFYIDQSTVPASLVPLLALLGSYLIILRRRK